MQLIEVPIAVQPIGPGTKISEELLTTKLTNADMIPDNIVYDKEITEGLEIHYVETMDEVLKLAIK